MRNVLRSAALLICFACADGPQTTENCPLLSGDERDDAAFAITADASLDDPSIASNTPDATASEAPDGVDAAATLCPPTGRIVVVGDSRAAGYSTPLAVLLGRPVEPMARGGAVTRTLKDVEGAPATILLDIGINDLRGEQRTASQVITDRDAWTARQIARGHRVVQLAMPRASGDIVVTDVARVAVNAHYGALELIDDARIGDRSDPSDTTWFVDRVHYTTAGTRVRAEYAWNRLAECPKP